MLALLDRLRRLAGVLMGLAPDPGAVELASPKIAVLCPPRPFRTLDGRLVAAAGDPLRVGNPSGVVRVAAEVVAAPGGWRAASARLYRTARTLMRGQVAVSGVR